jgi:alkanesulfonate monooxygenase SsuD/methylene tetrahydromethanopterin reductase-like flavin-dependent oxidoreductase (luciferase family)
VATARRAAAATITFYATVNTTSRYLRRSAKVGAIRDALMKNDVPGMIDAVSEGMVDALAVAGVPDDARRRLAPYMELADSICLAPPDQLIEPTETDRYREALLATFAD